VKTEEHLVNYSYQASRNLFGLNGPLGNIYPTFKFWFKRFTAIAPCSILAFGCIILAFLRLKSWYILKIKNQPSIEQPSLGQNYNTQGKNPIIFNVKGLLITTLLLTTVFLMLTQLQEGIDLHKNYILCYMVNIPVSIIIPGLYFLSHPKF